MRCDRCGFLHPVGMLFRQKGLLVCSDHGCVDNMDVERRSVLIAEILAQPGEFENEAVEALIDPGETIAF
jgi:hypothetical protein